MNSSPPSALAAWTRCIAPDTRLGRAAAIKTLTPEFAQDEDRRARFEREAKTLASRVIVNWPALLNRPQPGTGGTALTRDRLIQ
jgi:hypothetical protein